MNAPLKTARVLVACYAGLSACSLVVLIALTIANSPVATIAAWIRLCIVFATSLLMLAFARGAVRGSSRALLRWRIVVAIMIVAIAVVVSIPGLFPLWLQLEQIVCGLLLIAVAALIFRRQTTA
ncbi:hypothetical protein ACX9R5_12365 [Rathayibacter sp. CAU 1779]